MTKNEIYYLLSQLRVSNKQYIRKEEVTQHLLNLLVILNKPVGKKKS